MQKHKRYLAQYICPPRPNWYQRTWMVYPDTKDGITVTVKWLIFVSQFRCSNNSLTLKHETTLCSDGRAISAIETGKWTSHPSCLDPPAETKRRYHSWYNSCWCCSKEKRRRKSTPQSVMFIVVENWHWNPTSPTLCSFVSLACGCSWRRATTCANSPLLVQAVGSSSTIMALSTPNAFFTPNSSQWG